jgi:hypothetical protein
MREFPDLPERMKALPRDDRGFPVPWFVAWILNGVDPAKAMADDMYDVKDKFRPDSTPDFRVIAPRAREVALMERRCWVCGNVLGRFTCYVIGPMCAINRTTSEPGSHRECAEFSARNCPFLANPRMRRNEKNLPEAGFVEGNHLDRNPGATCLWITDKAPKPFRVSTGGFLIRIPEPTEVLWFASGRAATREEVVGSIDSGIHHLIGAAAQEGPEAIAELANMKDIAMKYLPEAA